MLGCDSSDQQAAQNCGPNHDQLCCNARPITLPCGSAEEGTMCYPSPAGSPCICAGPFYGWDCEGRPPDLAIPSHD